MFGQRPLFLPRARRISSASLLALAVLCADSGSVRTLAQEPLASNPADLFSIVSPAVVRISVHDKDMTPVARGSGFYVSDDGLVVTSSHVIDGAYFVFIDSPGAETQPVEGVVAVDRGSDLALLKAQPSSTKGLRLGASLPPVGTRVFAVGSPKGLANTLSDGLVSGHRRLDDGLSLIQTTAAISPGSSGGPLLTSDGVVVGVMTAYLSDGQNINFAVPVLMVQRLLEGRHELKKVASAAATLSSPQDTRRIASVWAAIDRKDYGGALKLLQQLRPQYGETFAYLFATGYVHSKMENYDLAVDAYRAAIRRAPKETVAHHNLSLAYAKLGRHDEAMSALENLISVDPENLDVYAYLWEYMSWRASVLALSYDADKSRAMSEGALTVAKRAALRAPSEPRVYRQLGATYQRLGQFDQAISSFRSALEINPRDALAQLGLGQAYMAWYRSESSALTSSASGVAGSGNLAGQGEEHKARLRGMLKKAVESVEEALRLEPVNTKIQLELGLVYDHLVHVGEGAEYAKKSLALYEAAASRDPNNASAHGVLSQAYAQRSQFGKAMAELEKHMELDPQQRSFDMETLKRLRAAARCELKCEIPETWVAFGRGDSTGEVAAYRAPMLPGGEQEPCVTISHPSLATLPWVGPDVGDQIVRWAKRFAVAPETIKRERFSVNGLDVTTYEVRGYLRGAGAQPRPPNDNLLLGAFVEGAGGPWAIEIIGPAGDVGEARADFVRMIRSVKRAD